MTTETIEIVCCTDANYVPHTAALLASIEDNSSDQHRFHIVHDAVPESLRDEVNAQFSNLDINWYSVVDHPALSLPPLLQISRATYLRLIIDEVLDVSVLRVLYLDVDMIVTGSLKPLWNTDLGSNLSAAVEDPGIDAKQFAEKFNLPSGGQYFNAGMVLFDLGRIRTEGVFKRCLDRMLGDPAAYELADQDGLNEALWGAWCAVDPTWNFQRKFLYDEFDFISTVELINGLPRIIHFTESTKPWQSAEWHPYTWLYLKYLDRTSFGRDVCKAGQIGTISRLKSWLRFHLKRPRLSKS